MRRIVIMVSGTNEESACREIQTDIYAALQKHTDMNTVSVKADTVCAAEIKIPEFIMQYSRR